MQRRSLLLAIALGVALAASVTAREKKPAPDADDLPDGVERYSQVRSECFAPGEIDAYDAQLDQSRIAVPGCAKGVIPPQQVVQGYKVYKPKSNHTIDCTTARQEVFGRRNLDLYLKEMVEQSEAPKGATCAANMAYAWAKADALTSTGSGGHYKQSMLNITATLGGVSAAYLSSPPTQARARAIPAGGGTADDVITGWFRKLAGSVSGDISTELAAHNEDNLQYWRAFAILPTALLTRDPSLLAQSRGVFDRAMQDVTSGPPANDAGFLPLEMQRYDKALHYQSFAVFPLVGAALLSQVHGCDFLTPGQQGKFALMMERTLQGSFDPQIFTIELSRLRGKDVPQIASTYARRSPQLLYLVNSLDPKLYATIDRDLSRDLGRPRPVISADVGATASFDRLGGSFRSLAQTARALRDASAPGLQSVCRPS